MKLIIVFFYLLIVSSVSFSQVITITDIETAEPLEHVTLFSELPSVQVTTGIKGQVNIIDLKGAERIEVYVLGYETVITHYKKIESDSFKLQLKPSLLSTEEIIISATRWRQISGDVPTKIITISAREIEVQNPQTAADLLNISGKVYIQKSQQGGGSPMIRGFASNRLLYTVDGVRMNTAIFRGGNIQNVIALDPFAIYQAEVLFGPGSVSYGSDAIGGVMSFQTLNPQLSLSEKPVVNVKSAIRYSSANNEKTGHVDFNLGFNRWAFISSISSNDFDDLRMGNNGPDDYLKSYLVQRIDGHDIVKKNNNSRVQDPTAYSQTNLMQKIYFKANEKLEFNYGFHFSESSDYGRYDRHLRFKDGLPRYGEWNYGPQKWIMNNLNISFNNSNPAFNQMSLRLAQQLFQESRIDRELNSDIRHVKKEEVNAYSVNLDFVKATNSRHKLFYGFEYVINSVNSQGYDENIISGIKVAGAARYPRSTWQSMAVYINDQYKLTDKVSVHAGLRYSQFMLKADFDTTFYPFPFTRTTINNGAFTGSIGAVYHPDKTLTITSNLATGFRSPNVDDIGKVFDSEAGSVTIPNPNLKDEYVYNADLGITKIYKDILKIDLSLYYSLLHNAMVTRNFALNGQDSILYDGDLSRVQALQNAAVAYVYGLQAGLEIKILNGLVFNSSFSYQKGEEELDNGSTSPLRHAAPWFGTSGINYYANNFNLQLYSTYQGELGFNDMALSEQTKSEIYAKDSNGNPYSPAWTTLNFKALYILSDNFTLTGGLENMGDSRYRPYSSGITAAGRNYILTISIKF